MPITEVTLSSKHQIVVPREARKALGLKPGDKLVIVTLGERVLVIRRPASYVEATHGLAKDMYSGAYLQRERRTWDK